MAFTPLNALNAYLAVARRRSFAAAAAELGGSPSALSQSVRQLEMRLGVSLLMRTSRSVSLTEEGQRLLESAGPAVDQALELLKKVTVRAEDVTGRIRLTVPSFSVRHVVAPLLPRFLARHPHVEVDVRVENHFVDIVTEGLDAGIRFSDSIERDMVQVRLLGPSRFVVVAAPAYLARKGTPEKPEDLLTHDCICIRSASTGPRYVWELERGKRNWRIPVQGPVETNDEVLMRVLAEEGVGLLYTFEPQVAAELKRGSLRVVLEPYAALVPGLYLYYPSRAQVSRALKAFVGVARELAAEWKDQAR